MNNIFSVPEQAPFHNPFCSAITVVQCGFLKTQTTQNAIAQNTFVSGIGLLLESSSGMQFVVRMISAETPDDPKEKCIRSVRLSMLQPKAANEVFSAQVEKHLFQIEDRKGHHRLSDFREIWTDNISEAPEKTLHFLDQTIGTSAQHAKDILRKTIRIIEDNTFRTPEQKILWDNRNFSENVFYRLYPPHQEKPVQVWSINRLAQKHSILSFQVEDRLYSTWTALDFSILPSTACSLNAHEKLAVLEEARALDLLPHFPVPGIS